MENQASKQPQATSSSASGPSKQPQATVPSSTATATAIMDMKLSPLKCILCKYYFNGKVYSSNCNDLICSKCYKRDKDNLNKQGAKRYKLVERLPERILDTCVYRPQGCNALLQLGNIRWQWHEYYCKYAPYRCPICNFVGALLYDHIQQHHNNTAVCVHDKSVTVTMERSDKMVVLLLLKYQRIVLLLNCGGNKPQRRSLQVLSIGPPPTAHLTCTMKVPLAVGQEYVLLSGKGRLVSVPMFNESMMTEEGLLIIPNRHWSSSKRMKVTLHFEVEEV